MKVLVRTQLSTSCVVKRNCQRRNGDAAKLLGACLSVSIVYDLGLRLYMFCLRYAYPWKYTEYPRW